MRSLWVVAFVAGAALAPHAAQSVATARAEFDAGQKLFAAGRYVDAERQFELAVAKQPNDALVWSWLAQSRYAQKRWTAAIEAFERTRALAPDDHRVYGNLGVCHFSEQDLARAQAAFARAVELDPAYSRAHMFLARIAAARGDDQAAERSFARAVEIDPPDPLAPFYFGLFLFQARRLDEAERQFERCLALTPDLPGAHLNLGLILQRKGDEPRARVHLQRFRELTEIEVGDERVKLRVTHLLRSANSEIEAGRFDSAFAAALEACEAAPELAVPQQFLARIYTLQGRLEDAARAQTRFRELSLKANAK